MWECCEKNQAVKVSAVIPVNTKKKGRPENLFPLFDLGGIDPNFMSLYIK